jgi:hypothetical protein
MSTQIVERKTPAIEFSQQAEATAPAISVQAVLTAFMAVGALIGGALCLATIKPVSDSTTLVFFVTTAAVTSAAVGAAAGLSLGGLWHILVHGSLDDQK